MGVHAGPGLADDRPRDTYTEQFTDLLGLVAVKWWNGTWGKSCDYVLSLVE